MKSYIDFLMEGNEYTPFRLVVDNLDEQNFEDAAKEYAEQFNKGKLTFEQLKESILKHNAKDEYKQVAIVMLRTIFEDHKKNKDE